MKNLTTKLYKQDFLQLAVILYGDLHCPDNIGNDLIVSLIKLNNHLDVARALVLMYVWGHVKGGDNGCYIRSQLSSNLRDLECRIRALDVRLAESTLFN